MITDEHVPSECDVRADFVWTHTRNFDCYLMGWSLASEQEHYGAQFDAMIARVRREAKAEALREAAENVDVGALADAWTRGGVTRLSVTNAVAEVLMSLRNRATEEETGD